MLKKFGLLAVAGIAALALGTAVFGGSQSASAETTGILDVHCELIDSYVATDACVAPLTATDIADLAGVDGIGDEDGDLEIEDFSTFEHYDASQLSDACTYTAVTTDGGIVAAVPSFGCTMLIFVFVDDEKPVTLDNDSGITSLQALGAATDFICDTDGDGSTLGQDNDCSDTIPSNGDGVVVFHVVNADGASGADRGDEKVVRASQEAVEQATTLTLVGIPDDVELVLAEGIIGTNGSVSASNACAANTDVTEAIEPAESTTALVTLEDQDNVLVTMWPVALAVDPPGDDPSVAQLGNDSNTLEDIDTNTAVTINPGDDLPIGFYIVVCGGSGTGETELKATSLTDGSVARADLTVVGFANATALVAAPAEIKCDGSETSTVTATITDSDGNNVADGTEVTFSVVALGTANPINTTTTDGIATSVITPLSNSSAGVTVIVSVDNGSDASTVSIRVDCALPLETQPTLAPPPTVPTGPIAPPDTGNGGYLAQDGGSSLWTMIALAIGGTIVVAGGLVARRSSN